MASSGRDFDPRTRAFSDEELKPQPMIKKSRKQVNDVSALIIPSGMLRSACGCGAHGHTPSHTPSHTHKHTAHFSRLRAVHQHIRSFVCGDGVHSGFTERTRSWLPYQSW